MRTSPLAHWANRRPRPDRAGRRRDAFTDRDKWKAWRWAGTIPAALGCTLVGAVLFGNLSPVIAVAFAIGLLIGSVIMIVAPSRRPRLGDGIIIVDDDAPSTRWESPVKPVLSIHREEAGVTLDRGSYHIRVRRWLTNHGTEPVTGTTLAVTVDRYPAESIRSRRFHRQNPLSVDEVKLSARLNGRAIRWKLVDDHDSHKEVELRFESDDERLPLYPGETALLEYSYSIGVDKWGQWFSRSIQVPTRTIVMEVRLPARLVPRVWGTVRNSLAELETAMDITRSAEGAFTVFRWQADNPRMLALLRMGWELASPAQHPITQ